MDTYNLILQSLILVFLILGFIYRKKKWGSKLIYFALGMFVMFMLTDWFEGAFRGLGASVGN